jgi:hypothetical protein
MIDAIILKSIHGQGVQGVKVILAPKEHHPKMSKPTELV